MKGVQMLGIGKFRDYRNLRSFKKRVSFQNVPVEFYTTLNEHRKDIGRLTRKEGCKLIFHQDSNECVNMTVMRSHGHIIDGDYDTHYSLWGFDGASKMPNRISRDSIIDTIKKGIDHVKRLSTIPEQRFVSTQSDRTARKSGGYLDPG